MRKIVSFQAHEQQNRVDIRWQKKETHDTDQPQHVVCCLSSRVERLVRNIILLLKLSDSYKDV